MIGVNNKNKTLTPGALDFENIEEQAEGIFGGR